MTGKLADPEFRRERARKASAAAHSTDRYISALVKRAPELTAANRAQLRALLASVDGGQRSDG
ncbi:hypothetical protein L083_7422 [Actinoplanes sp. N902-109]|nr:hypothetical protein L083_7422 [Actinoplanes sp. N902-109]